MTELQNLIDQNSPLSSDQILKAFLLIGQYGDIMMIKNDGLREKDKFTVLINSTSKSVQNIRFDDDSLSDALKKALMIYLNN